MSDIQLRMAKDGLSYLDYKDFFIKQYVSPIVQPEAIREFEKLLAVYEKEILRVYPEVRSPSEFAEFVAPNGVKVVGIGEEGDEGEYVVTDDPEKAAQALKDYDEWIGRTHMPDLLDDAVVLQVALIEDLNRPDYWKFIIDTGHPKSEACYKVNA